MDQWELDRKYSDISGYIIEFAEQAYEDISDDDIIEEYFNSNASYYYKIKSLQQEHKNLSKSEIIDKYIKPMHLDYLKTKLLPQAYEVLSLDPFPKDAVELTAIIWFESADETKAWLKEVISKLEKRIAKAEAEGK